MATAVAKLPSHSTTWRAINVKNYIETVLVKNKPSHSTTLHAIDIKKYIDIF